MLERSSDTGEHADGGRSVQAVEDFSRNRAGPAGDGCQRVGDADR
jgi:hypothetical protein